MIFLQRVAEDLYQKFGKDISTIAMVFPNKRPAAYLRKWLGGVITEPVWSPPMFTIHEFILSATDRLPADRLLQVFQLFEAYREVMSAAGEPFNDTFDTFYPFGEILLNDFTDLESNLAVVEDVYATLFQIEQLEKSFEYLTPSQKDYLRQFWASFSEEKLSRQQDKFLRLWKYLPHIYRRFTELLAHQQLINTGTAYRLLASDEHDRKDFDNRFTRVAFIGFNALNQAEISLFRKWKESGKALFYFDADEYYIDDELQEAGRFLRRNLKLFGNEIETGNAIRNKNKNVSYIPLEGDAAQVQVIANLLHQETGGVNPDQTAILLADEKQLMPLLSSLPESLPVNITMGFPLQRSLVWSLISNLLELQRAYHQYGGSRVHIEPLLAFLEHPWLLSYAPAREAAKRFIDGQSILVPAEIIMAEKDDLLVEMISRVDKPEQIFQLIRKFTTWWLNNPQGSEQTVLEIQLATAALEQVNRLDDLVGKFEAHLSIPFVVDAIRSVLSGMTVPLEGDPLEGIQIMGLLESRGLDFENVYLLQMNEGIFPRRAAAPTFLPDSIRRAFHLSVLENQDSIFAYVFYRLLQHARQVTCTWNNIVSEQSTGEKSRFLTQLHYESGLAVHVKKYALPVTAYWKPSITIPKDARTMGLLKRFSHPNNKLTPSAINTYLDCRLRFFYQYVSRIKEPESAIDIMDPRLVGKILHSCLELLYKKLEKQKGNRTVEKSDIAVMEAWLDESVLDIAFSVEILGSAALPFSFSGSTLVLRDIIRSYARTILKADEVYAPFIMEEMEANVAVPYTVRLEERAIPIFLGGYIDRIDRRNGIYRIIDYKTGRDDKEIPSVESLFARDKKRNKAALQTILYAWVLQQQKPAAVSIETGLYDLRNMTGSPVTFDWRFRLTGKNQRETISHSNHAYYEAEVMERLSAVIGEIFDESVAFDQTTLMEKCRQCPYDVLCGR
ncbi:PD-(D/E)XK nuclease family protein [Flavihumibacter petaseus]|uniref:PD-(D/E)XK endonuclease-like domain-containing protein n=1 Tax=Flavihumibacter petaseus NBRC 106054 TaxID=1220578 RepID=A0A0E9MX03_9BACT|nr:PD-(D/E)XK nuclease family protein [Flavihumibacter petaseus]GAO42277.1 hypothetical protein FPE01S_01_12900 [Flavihumibacter petaseus NBRC 106054]